MYLRLLIAAAAVCLSAANATAHDPTFLGEITTFGGNFCPNGYLPTDGRLLSIAENDTLYILLGTAYGGDGETTFGLPMMSVGAAPTADSNATPVHACIAISGVFPPRN